MIQIAPKLRADLNSGLSVFEDLCLQVALLTALQFHSESLGRSKIPYRSLEDDWIRCTEDFPARLRNEENLAKRMENIQQYFSPRVFRADSNYVEVVRFPAFDWSGLPEEMNKMRIRMQQRLSEIHAQDMPALLAAEKARLEAELAAAKMSGETNLIATCGIFGVDEIRTALEELIGRAQERIYLMVAYYQENADFFASFLAERVRKAELDFRILYRPGDAQNRKLVLKLKEKLEPHGYRDFFRSYEAKYLDDSFSDRLGSVGNLHAKVTLSEKELLVGSANLTHLALNHNVEVAIETRDPRIVESARVFYEKLWKALDVPTVIE